MFDTDPTTATRSKTCVTNKRIIQVATTTKSNQILSRTDVGAIKGSKRVEIPPGMFDTGPTPECAVVSVTKVARKRPMKKKSTRKPTPTIVSNTYECLAKSDDDEDDDDSRDRPGTRMVDVDTRELRNRRIKKNPIRKTQAPTVVVDLGTMITTTKGMSDVETGDEMSTVTVTSTNTREEKQTKQIEIPAGTFDTDILHNHDHYGKQVSSGGEEQVGQKRSADGDEKADQSDTEGNSGNDNNDNNNQNEKTPKPSQFNDERCPGKLSAEEPVDVDEFQTFNIVLKFKDVPLKKVANVVTEYSIKCITKVPGLTFHPTNNNTLPTPSPINTAEGFPTNNTNFLEFFYTVMTEVDVTVYYKIMSPVSVTELRSRVFHFMKDKGVWMHSKQISDNRPMDAAVIFRGHKRWSNKHVIYKKINKAMKKLETEKAITEEQQLVLTELLKDNNYGWTIMNKRHTYTDGRHARVYTDGLIIVVKKPFLRMAQEIFSLIRVKYTDFLGGGMQLLATGSGDIHGYEGYKAMTTRNNEYHNITDCVTVTGYHPEHRNLVIKWGNYKARKVYHHLSDIDGVFDVVETNESQSIGKYFVICERSKRAEVEKVIHEINKALVRSIQDDADSDAKMHFNQYPSLRTKMSLGGYTEQAAALDADIFSPITNSSPQQAIFDMSLDFGPEAMVGSFPLLSPPVPVVPNPWKPTTTENQLALREERSTVSMTDNSFTTSIATLQSEMSRMLTSMVTLNEQQRAADQKRYEEREIAREAQRKIIDDKRDADRQDDLRRMEKLEGRNETTSNALLQMLQ